MRLYITQGNHLICHNMSDNSVNYFNIDYVCSEDYTVTLLFEKISGNWVIRSNQLYYVYKDEGVYENYLIKEYDDFILHIKENSLKLHVFVSPSAETINTKKVYDLDYNGLNKIKIGNSNKCNIYYKNPYTNQNHAEIVKDQNGDWFIEAKQNSEVYLNQYLITAARLNTGDVIFINGLKIIWNKYFLRINNPNNSLLITGFKQASIETDNTKFEKEEDNNEVLLYKSNEYFCPKLRISSKVVEEKIVIDAPPFENEDAKMERLNSMANLGSSITMIASISVMIYYIVYNLMREDRDMMMIIPSIVTCSAMLLGGFMLPRIVSFIQKRQTKKRRKAIMAKYNKYIDEKEIKIKNIIAEQSEILKYNNPSVNECYEMLKYNPTNNVNFWSRSVEDDNFISLRLGLGNRDASIYFQIPERDFNPVDSEVLDRIKKLKEDYSKLYNVPIVFSLTQNNKVALMSTSGYLNHFLVGIVLQLITMQSPKNLKIVIFTSKQNAGRWSFIKYLPHCQSDDKQVRFFATNVEEMQEISAFIEVEYQKRKTGEEEKMKNSLTIEAEKESFNKKEAYKNHNPYYIVIDDNFVNSKNIKLINLLLETDVNYGFSYIGVGNTLKDVPDNCVSYLDITGEDGSILKKNINVKEIVTFKLEPLNPMSADTIIQKISNVPIEIKELESSLPTVLPFLEMLSASKIEQLNILQRWKNNNPILSLGAPVGVHTNGDLFKLDVHEKVHGPHGLIAGMTGSGKSEFIITYILSMIINYHPYEVQFVLIDYKGGGLAGAFENKELDIKIPHLVGTITNIDTAEINRALASIESESRRRQKIFNEVREQLGESTIDIYKYQKLYREGVIKEPMAHLIIVCDEFAELKQQQPDFMNELISIARIGRSLGIHLILATQKPSGVVNDQIWSNSKFKVCLKVQDRSDSNEMLKKPDAANLKDVGRFYLQVGYDDYFDIGQSAWSGIKYVPTDNIIKKIDDSINFVNNVGTAYKSAKELIVYKETVDLGDQLTNIVKEIDSIGKNNQIITNTLWLDPINPIIYIQNIKEQYGYKPTSYFINPVIGIYDNPEDQEQGLLTLNISGGNTLIFGKPNSGKEFLLTTTIYSIIAEHTPDEVNVYILDFGSGSLKAFNNMPHVGDITTVEEPEKVEDTFNMLFEEIEYRKKEFENFSGSYDEYCLNSGKKLPLIVTIINNYEVFVENNPKLSEAIQTIYRDGAKYGVMFIISVISPGAMRTRIAQYFNNLICLQLADDSEYRNILGARRGLIPASYYGRGIIRLNDSAYEFQTASILPKAELINYLRNVSLQLSKAYISKAKRIPTIPEVIDYNELIKLDINQGNLPIGYDIFTKTLATYDFYQKSFLPILTENMSNEKMEFVYGIINMLKKQANEVRVIDFVEAYEQKDDTICYKDNFSKNIITIYNEIVTNRQSSKKYFYIILGIGQYRKKLSGQEIDLFNKVLENTKESDSIEIIMVDTYISYKNIQTDLWYQNNVDPLYGIWMGENVGSQLAINFNNIPLEERKIELPQLIYVANNGKHKIIKHMVGGRKEE